MAIQGASTNYVIQFFTNQKFVNILQRLKSKLLTNKKVCLEVFNKFHLFLIGMPKKTFPKETIKFNFHPIHKVVNFL